MACSVPRRLRATITTPSAAQLGPEQAARLAGMVPNPRYYDRNRSAPGLGAQSGDHSRADAGGRSAVKYSPA